MRTTTRFSWLAALCFFAALSANSAPARAAADSEADLAQGKTVYREHCLRCHGKAGRGDGRDAVRLGFKPRDFTLASFKCQCTPAGSLPRDEDLLRVIERGLPGAPMPGYESRLSETESRNLVAYVKTLIPAFAESVAPPCLEVPPPLAESPESIAEGKQVYRLLECWTCHGAEGRGDGPEAKAVVDEWGEPLRVYNFTRRGRLKCGGEDEALYRLLQNGLAGSPMASYADELEFSGDGAGDLGALGEVFSDAALEELTAYLAEQPDATALAQLTEAERKALGDRRAWSLIHYLRSLITP